jgi:uncharacterized protein
LKILVADTSPLISLLVTNHLFILFDLYKEIYIPEAVWNELKNHAGVAGHHPDIEKLAPLVRACNIKLNFPEIDRGESEAISLYKELNADYLLIDDKKGRQVAESNFVNCIGTLGILITAKQKNMILSLRLVFEQLILHKRFYHKELLNKILSVENEPLL